MEGKCQALFDFPIIVNQLKEKRPLVAVKSQRRGPFGPPRGTQGRQLWKLAFPLPTLPCLAHARATRSINRSPPLLLFLFPPLSRSAPTPGARSGERTATSASSAASTPTTLRRTSWAPGARSRVTSCSDVCWPKTDDDDCRPVAKDAACADCGTSTDDADDAGTTEVRRSCAVWKRDVGETGTGGERGGERGREGGGTGTPPPPPRLPGGA